MSEASGPKHPIKGASVLLAGASGGLGQAFAAELQERGALLTMVARDQSRLDAVPAEGARLAVDLRTPDGCAAAVAAAKEHGGGLNIVINAVGVVAFGTVAELSVDVMEELFLTNTFVPIMLAGAALPLLDKGDAIVNISGVIAEKGLPGMAAYGASKAAVRSFDEALQREARREGVRVLDARPGHTETGLVSRALAGEAPDFAEGLQPKQVAVRICDALEAGTKDLPSEEFGD